MTWTFTADIALGDNGKPVFILSPPNDGKGTNEVQADGQPLDLALDLSKFKPVITSVDTHTIQEGGPVVVTVTGTNLIGTFTLKRGTDSIPAEKVEVILPNRNASFADLKQVKITFDLLPVSLFLGAGYSLQVENTGGKANEPGFKVEN
ncbi:MAG: hypothetical protein ACREP2_13270 [Rhodanobacteraceae bacterium]